MKLAVNLSHKRKRAHVKLLLSNKLEKKSRSDILVSNFNDTLDATDITNTADVTDVTDVTVAVDTTNTNNNPLHKSAFCEAFFNENILGSSRDSYNTLPSKSTIRNEYHKNIQDISEEVNIPIYKTKIKKKYKKCSLDTLQKHTISNIVSPLKYNKDKKLKNKNKKYSSMIPLSSNTATQLYDSIKYIKENEENDIQNKSLLKPLIKYIPKNILQKVQNNTKSSSYLLLKAFALQIKNHNLEETKDISETSSMINTNTKKKLIDYTKKDKIEQLQTIRQKRIYYELPQWNLYQQNNLNILQYGIGSKYETIKDFQLQYCGNGQKFHLEIYITRYMNIEFCKAFESFNTIQWKYNGYNTIDEIDKQVQKLYDKCPINIPEQVQIFCILSKKLSNIPIYIFAHSIDTIIYGKISKKRKLIDDIPYNSIINIKEQNFILPSQVYISEYCNENVHIILTVDHIDSTIQTILYPIVQEQQMYGALDTIVYAQWIQIPCNTYIPYTKEIIDDTDTAIDIKITEIYQDTNKKSLQYILQSLTNTQLRILQNLAQQQQIQISLEVKSSKVSQTSISLSQLASICFSQMIVHSESILQKHLQELQEQNLIKFVNSNTTLSSSVYIPYSNSEIRCDMLPFIESYINQ